MRFQEKWPFSRRDILGVLVLLGSISVLFAADSLLAETLTYREVEGSLVTVHTVAVTPAPPGYRVELTSQRAGARKRSKPGISL